MLDQINKLQQIVSEDTYSKRNIREVLIEDIKDSNLVAIFDKCVTSYQSYLNKSYWKSKDLRISHLKSGEVNPNKIMFYIFLFILSKI